MTKAVEASGDRNSLQRFQHEFLMQLLGHFALCMSLLDSFFVAKSFPGGFLPSRPVQKIPDRAITQYPSASHRS